jgi:hypothetical protein
MRSERAEKLLKLRQNFCSIKLVASRSVSVKCIWEILIDDYFYMNMKGVTLWTNEGDLP